MPALLTFVDWLGLSGGALRCRRQAASPRATSLAERSVSASRGQLTFLDGAEPPPGTVADDEFVAGALLEEQPAPAVLVADGDVAVLVHLRRTFPAPVPVTQDEPVIALQLDGSGPLPVRVAPDQAAA